MIFEYNSSSVLEKSTIIFLYGLYVLNTINGFASSFKKTSQTLNPIIKEHREKYLMGVSIVIETKLNLFDHPQLKYFELLLNAKNEYIHIKKRNILIIIVAFNINFLFIFL